MLEVRSASAVRYIKKRPKLPCTYDRTFEKSLEGDMTKLSLVLDHEIRCWMVWSSSILGRGVWLAFGGSEGAVGAEAHLYSL